MQTWTLYVYNVIFDALSIHHNDKFFETDTKYENRQKPVIFGKNWPSQGRNMRIIAIQIIENELFSCYLNYFSSLFHPDLSAIRKNND